MCKNWGKLIVALDLEKKEEICRVVKALSPKGVKFKIGSIAFTKFGPEFVKSFVDRGADIFLDLKLHDIPNTMKKTAAIIAQMKCWAFTVHTCAGKEALTEVKKEVVKAARKYKVRRPLILGVSVLTSQKSTREQVLKLIKVAYEAGLDGVISSPQEAGLIKKRYKRLKVITPGIRGLSDNLGDQKRVATAQYAFKQGADCIVVGRPIVQKKNYLKAAETVLNC